MEPERYAQAVAAMTEQGRLDEAIDLAHEALQRLADDHSDRPLWLAQLGELYDGIGDVTRAESSYTNALTLLGEAKGREGVRARLLTDLGRVYLRQQKHLEAEETARQAVDVVESSPSADATNIAFALRHLAVVYLYRRDFGSAEPVLERVLRLVGTALAPDDPEIATALTDLAHVYEQRGRADDAESLREEARAIVAAPYRRLSDRIEDMLRACGATERQLAEVVHGLAQGHQPPQPYLATQEHADALDELAWMLFVRAPELNRNAIATSAMMVDLARNGAMSWSEILEHLAATEVAAARA